MSWQNSRFFRNPINMKGLCWGKVFFRTDSGIMPVLLASDWYSLKSSGAKSVPFTSANNVCFLMTTQLDGMSSSFFNSSTSPWSLSADRRMQRSLASCGRYALEAEIWVDSSSMVHATVDVMLSRKLWSMWQYQLTSALWLSRTFLQTWLSTRRRLTNPSPPSLRQSKGTIPLKISSPSRSSPTWEISRHFFSRFCFFSWAMSAWLATITTRDLCSTIDDSFCMKLTQ